MVQIPKVWNPVFYPKVEAVGGWLPKVARETASVADTLAGKAVCLWCVSQAAFQQKTSLYKAPSHTYAKASVRSVGLVFASTCCLSAPRHGCYFLAFGLVDCLRQEGQKPKPQPEFVRACWPLPVPYSRTRSTLNAQAVRAASRSPSRVPFPWQAGCGSRRRPASASDYISSIS